MTTTCNWTTTTAIKILNVCFHLPKQFLYTSLSQGYLLILCTIFVYTENTPSIQLLHPIQRPGFSHDGTSPTDSRVAPCGLVTSKLKHKQFYISASHLCPRIVAVQEWEDCSPDQPGHKWETLFEKYLKQKRVEGGRGRSGW
jgi:hypothetical protein